MSLMGSLYVGVSGLNVSQNGLNTTGHNLANVETEGYVRQQTVLQTSQYRTIGQSYISPMQTGLGAETAAVRQVRDIFLDKSYRQELGRRGFYDSQYETVSEIENLMGELEGVAFQDSIADFWNNLQELAKEPDSLVKRASLVETSVSFIERSENLFKQLRDYQLNLNLKITNTVSRINEIGDKISELNDRICAYESNGYENANDLRDSRNKLLDELSQMITITYRENPEGRVTVNAEGVPFVTEDVTHHMGTMTVTQIRERELGSEEFDNDATGTMENSEMLIPVWPTYGEVEVYNRDLIPNSADNSDIGSLKGLILARGTKVAKATDIPIAPNKDDYMDEFGTLNEESYNLALKEYKEDAKTYNQTIEPSIVMSTQAQYDQLIHGIVTTINDILCPNKEVVIAAGTTIELANGDTYTYENDTVIKVFDDENAPIGINGEGGTELFSRKSMPRYTDYQEITLANGEIIRAKVYNEEDPNNNYSLYTVGELVVNQEMIEDKSKMPLSQNSNTGDYDIKTTEKLLKAWQEPFATLSPNTLTKSNFNDYYNTFIGSIATTGERYDTIVKSQEGMVASIDNQRQSVLGVSSDDELTNLIKFQHAYNAAARYMNVIDQMLEHIVTRI